MPDRDFISTHVRSPWRPAARLWVREGATSTTIDRIAEILAKVLRDGGLDLDRARTEAQRASLTLGLEDSHWDQRGNVLRLMNEVASEWESLLTERPHLRRHLRWPAPETAATA